MTKINWFYKNQVSFEWKYWMTMHAFWIEFELNPNSKIQFKYIEWNSNSTIEIKIELKWNANWWRRYRKSPCEYGVGKRKNKYIDPKRHISMPLYLGMG
jgi:hypothetical protein